MTVVFMGWANWLQAGCLQKGDSLATSPVLGLNGDREFGTVCCGRRIRHRYHLHSPGDEGGRKQVISIIGFRNKDLIFWKRR